MKGKHAILTIALIIMLVMPPVMAFNWSRPYYLGSWTRETMKPITVTAEQQTAVCAASGKYPMATGRMSLMYGVSSCTAGSVADYSNLVGYTVLWNYSHYYWYHTSNSSHMNVEIHCSDYPNGTILGLQKTYGYLSGPTSTCIYALDNANPPICDINADPTSGDPATEVNFTTGNASSYQWSIYKGIDLETFSLSRNWSHIFNDEGAFTVNLTKTNQNGTCTASEEDLITIAQGDVYVDVDIRDATTGSLIQYAGYGIYDYTNTVWRNGTLPTGMGVFFDTGLSHEYPLYVGETVKLAGWATGYGTTYRDITIQYADQWHQSPNEKQAIISLVRNTSLPSSGNATVQVNVVSNTDGTALDNAWVLIENGDLLYGTSKYTTGGGSAVFENMPAGTFSMTVSKGGYQTATMFFDAPANLVTTEDISLVKIGLTATPTGTITVTGTVTASSTWSDMDPDDQDKALMDMIRDAGPLLVGLAILVTIMALLGMLGKSWK